MLIASKFHDFYDSIVAFGIDKTCVYQRTRKVLEGTFKFPKDNVRSYNSHWPSANEFRKTKKGIIYQYTAHKYVIGFCGKLYPLVFISKSSETKVQENAFYSVDSLYEFLEKEGANLQETYRYFFSAREYSIRSRESMEKFYSGEDFKGLEEEFHKNKCPVFIYGRFQTEAINSGRTCDTLILNPRLKDYKFMKMKDPQTAFQDIFMYLSGVLGVSAPEMVELTDKELAKKKGHGDPYSFRKPPGKRGKKKWR